MGTFHLIGTKEKEGKYEINVPKSCRISLQMSQAEEMTPDRRERQISSMEETELILGFEDS